jgi:hypothetical protein
MTNGTEWPVGVKSKNGLVALATAAPWTSMTGTDDISGPPLTFESRLLNERVGGLLELWPTDLRFISEDGATTHIPLADIELSQIVRRRFRASVLRIVHKTGVEYTDYAFAIDRGAVEEFRVAFESRRDSAYESLPDEPEVVPETIAPATEAEASVLSRIRLRRRFHAWTVPLCVVSLFGLMWLGSPLVGPLLGIGSCGLLMVLAHRNARWLETVRCPRCGDFFYYPYGPLGSLGVTFPGQKACQNCHLPLSGLSVLAVPPRPG